MMAPNGTRFGGWLLNTADNRFDPMATSTATAARDARHQPVGHRRVEASGRHDDRPGHGAQRHAFRRLAAQHGRQPLRAGRRFRRRRQAPRSSSPARGASASRSSRAATFTVPMMAPNGTRFGGWLLNTADNRFGPVGDVDGDGKRRDPRTSPWGIGILKLAATR